MAAGHQGGLDHEFPADSTAPVAGRATFTRPSRRPAGRKHSFAGPRPEGLLADHRGQGRLLAGVGTEGGDLAIEELVGEHHLEHHLGRGARSGDAEEALRRFRD